MQIQSKANEEKNNKYHKSTKCISPTNISDLNDGYKTF